MPAKRKWTEEQLAHLEDKNWHKVQGVTTIPEGSSS